LTIDGLAIADWLLRDPAASVTGDLLLQPLPLGLAPLRGFP
jgi:hypothetical protein